jgi:hypothetical protein
MGPVLEPVARALHEPKSAATQIRPNDFYVFMVDEKTYPTYTTVV